MRATKHPFGLVWLSPVPLTRRVPEHFLFPMPHRCFLTVIFLTVFASFACAGPVHLPHPEEADVACRIIERAGFDVQEKAPPEWAVRRLRAELMALGVDTGEIHAHGVASKEKPQMVLAFILNEDGRVVALRGNGPWLNNESMAELAAMPELRLIKIDHNGSTKSGPENDFDGSGLAALAGSKIVKVKLGLGFSDRGMAAAAKIRGLRALHVIHSHATEAGIDALAWHPALEDFSIAGMATGRVTPAALAKIARIPRIRRVGFRECYVTYAGGLEHLKPLAGQLTEINLGMCLVSPDDLALLKQDHAGVQVVTMTPEQIAKTHKWVAGNLAEQAPAELAEPLRLALAETK